MREIEPLERDVIATDSARRTREAAPRRARPARRSRSIVVRSNVRVVAILVAMAGVAAADPRPTLDDFYERTRTRDEGFGDASWLLHMIAGVQTANPSVEAAEPAFATGGRLGIEAGLRGGRASVVRTLLAADVLRVGSSGQWLADAEWQSTAFTAFGRERDDTGLHLSLASTLARRNELRPTDVVEFQRIPYYLVDVEGEATAIGPRIDKDGNLALPVGVANRMRWSLDGATLERRTTVSGAIAYRGFAKQMRNHAQLDFLRAKYTSWDVTGGDASALTLSAGYQRLPYGLDTLPLWALVGYEWAGDRSGAVVQIGMDLPFRGFEFVPELERHLELDPMTATFRRVTTGRFAFRHTYGPVRYGVTYEAASLEQGERFHAITPIAGVTHAGFHLGLSYRFVIAGETMTTARDRFGVALDRRF